MSTAQLRGFLVACLLAPLAAACGKQTADGNGPGQPDGNGLCTSANACDCCADGQVCFNEQCCTPMCDGKSCGSNGCGGTCGSCTQANYTCNEQTGRCECTREDDQAFCEAQGKPCGTASGKDRCGRDYSVTCNFCGDHQVCNLSTEKCDCVEETESELCLSLGKNCGAVVATDRCGNERSLNCGTCDPGFLCNPDNVCEVCIPDDVPTFCQNHGAACGSFSGVDNCGDPRQVDCGGCDPGTLCNTTTNKCDPCDSETEAQYCARVGGARPLDCGTINATDNCNVARTFNCGTCEAPRFCDSTNHCHDCIPESDPAFCGNQGKQCGPASGPDSCGNNRSVANCGSCAPTERCESGQCQVCVGETDSQLCTFYFKNCGTPSVLDSCGVTRTPNCGPATCTGALTCTDGVCSDGVHPTNDTCASPQRLMFDASGVATATGDLTAASGDYYGSCGGSGNDVVFVFTLPTALNVQVVVTATSTSIWPEAYIRDNCTNTNDLVCGYASNTGSNATVTARALPAGTYYLIIDGYSGNNGTFSLTATTSTPPPPPTNDTCATPETLVFTAGVATVTGDTSAAVNDYSDSCSWNTFDGADVVYKLTVTSASAVVATVTRDPSASNFYPAVQLLATCPSGGSALACATQTNGIASVANSNLAPGDYYVLVDGTSRSFGAFTLEVKMLPPVPNDLCTGALPVTLSPVAGTSDLQGTISGDTSIATDNDTSTCDSWNTGRDLVYSFEIPASTYYTINIDLTPASGSLLWPSLYVKTGCTAADVEKGCDAKSFSGPATLSFTRLGPGTYYVFVDGYNSNTNGPFDLTITASTPPPPPSNDTCTRPTVVTLDPTTGSATLTDSTGAAADDYAGGCANTWDTHTGPDLVYAVTIPAGAAGLGARVVADTSVSPNYKPVVYIQSVCGDNTTDQACGNYNWNGSAMATANNLTAGATYYIIVDGKSASWGSFTLSVVTFGALTNDNCSTAKTMVFNTSGDFSDRGDMCSANTDTMDVTGQTCSWSSGYGKDVVYKLVTTGAQNLTVNYLSGQAYTSQLYIRTSCATPGTQILCNEVNNGAMNSLTAKNLPAGEYYIWLDNAYWGDCGVFTMTAHVSTPPPPPRNDLCASADVIPIDTTTGIGTITGGTTDSSGNEQNGACANSSGGDVAYSLTLNSTQTVEITVTPQAGSDLKPIIYLRTDCGQVSTELGCTAINATNTAATLQFPRLAAGTYYLLVDSYDLNATGLFDIGVTTTTPPPPASNDLCSAAMAMPTFDPVTLKTSITGDTLNGNNDDTSGCATGSKRVSGPDLVYSFQLAADAKVTATVTRGSSSIAYKPAVAIRSGCALNQEVACNTDSQSGSSGSTSVTTALAAGTWYVFVDGIDGTYGPFTLEVSQVSGATVVAGDSCGSAIPLTVTGTTATATGDLTQAGLTDDYTGVSCATWYSSPDMVYTLTLTADSFVTVSMGPAATGGARLDSGSYLRRVCDDSNSEIACASTWTDGATITYNTTRLPAGTYYLFADALNSYYTGSFDLTVTVTPATGTVPSNDACRSPTPITFAGGVASVSVDTSGAFDDYSGTGTCGGFVGPLSGGDVVYSFTATAGATVAAVVTAAPTATGYKPAVYIRDTCASALPVNQLGCNTSTAPSAGVLVTNLAATTYYVVVDGQAGSGGASTLDLYLQTSPVNNSSCTAAQPLVFTTNSAGASVAQVVGDTNLGSNATAGVTQGSQYCYSDGSELYYSFSTTDVKDLTVDLTPLSTSYEPAVYVRATCTDPQSQVVCNYTWSGPLQVQKLRLPAGDYTIVVDSEYSSNNGPFSMKVTVAAPPPPPAWDTCRGAQNLTLPASGAPALVVTDSTIPANDNYVGGCASSNYPMDGGDVVYSFSVAANTLLTAKVTPKTNSPSYKAAVYIRSTCATVSDDVCAYPSWGSGPSNPALAYASLPVGNYFVIVDGLSGTAGDFDLELSTDDTLYVAGDHCINAISLDSTFVAGTLPGEMNATFTGTNVGARNDGDGACQSYSGNDLVYSFTVARSSVVTLGLGPSSGSGFNGYLYVRTACADSSTQVYCRTPVTGNTVSGMMFNVAPGTYYLFVDGMYSWSGSGSFDGSVSIRDTPAAPNNDVCRNATTLNFVSGGTGTAQNATLTGEDSTFATHDSSGNCFWSGGNDLVYTFTTTSAYSFSATVTPDSSSAWLRPSLYLRATACASSVSTAEVACGVATGANQPLTIRTNQLPAGTYYLFVDSATTASDPPGGRFDLTATLDTVAGTVPANDNCASAQLIGLTGQAPSVTTLTAQTTVGATDDTNNTCGQTGPDVVYYFDLTAEAQVKAKVTAGAGYNPAVALRSTCATAQIVCGSTPSGSIAEATAQYLPIGRYFLWVDAGNANSSGTFDLELTLSTPVVAAPPSNDLCLASVPTVTKGVAVTGTTVGAFNNYFNLASGACYSSWAPGPDVVYAYTPTTDGAFTVTLISNGADLCIWMSEGICGDPASCVAYNDWGSGMGGQDYFTYASGKAGVTYYLVVDSYMSTNSGTFTLTVN